MAHSGWRQAMVLGAACVLTTGGGAGTLAYAGEVHQAHEAHQTHEGHEGHLRHVDARPGYGRSLNSYRVPDVALVREDGTKVHFPKDIDDGKPVVLNFVFTSCTAICPVLSQTFAEFQARLGSEREQLHMLSISIDPEQDTPARLRQYAQRYEAGPQWHHYTGTVEASVAVQKAYQAYFGDKMHHRPVLYLRAALGQPWLRLDGMVTPAELLSEYRGLLAAKRSTGRVTGGY